MKKVVTFVTSSSDELGLKAVEHLRSLGCSTAVVNEGDDLPAFAIVFVTTTRPTAASGWQGGRHTSVAHLSPDLPNWTCGADGVIEIRYNPCGDFLRAVRMAARFKQLQQGGEFTPQLWYKRPKKARQRTRNINVSPLVCMQ